MAVDPLWASVAVTLVLVLVTIFYAVATHRILKEMQKDRKARYIERKLERLYYPIRLDQDPVRGGFYEKISGLSDRLGNFQYLGSERLKKELDAYLDFCKDSCSMGDSNKSREQYQKIKAIVEEEIPQIVEELNELTK